MSGFSWARVADALLAESRASGAALDEGQRQTLAFVAARIADHGVIVADEVGTGKTRIACAVIRAVLACGGRAAAVVPRGLMHQWRKQFAVVSPGVHAPRDLATVQQWLDGDGPAPSDAPEWWVVSHAFRYPQARAHPGLATPQDWRYALPSLVRTRLQTRTVRDGRTALGSLVRKTRHARAWRGGRWSRLGEIADRVAPLVRADPQLRKRLERLEVLNPGRDATAVREEFREGGPALAGARDLLRLWLGTFDLVVVDEAHRSRDELLDEAASPEHTKVLRGVLELLQAPGTQRRLCLTATPMELDPEQWEHLLARARVPVGSGARVRAVIREFRDALKALDQAPDERDRVERAIRGAQEFQRLLEPYVTRRRALGDGLQTQVDEARRRAGAVVHDEAHPHRNVGLFSPELASSDVHWRSTLAALEGLSRAAAGLDARCIGEQGFRMKTFYLHAASGHLRANDFGGGAWRPVVPADLGVAQRARLSRVRFWWSVLDRERRVLAAAATREGLTQYDPDAEHPRIRAAVDEIERWTRSGEKVLVFGVFTRPLHLLRDVIEARELLRRIDRDLPIPVALHEAGHRRLLEIAWRQYVLDPASRWEGALARGVDDVAALRQRARRSHGRYRNGQREVARWVRQALPALLEANGLKELRPATKERLAVVLRSLVMDEWLSRRAHAPRLDVKQLVREIWEAHAARALEPDEAGSPDGEDRVDVRARLERWIAAEHEDHASWRYCRVLDGDTKWETRRSIQAGFNREHGYPRVLVAQSLVGREGLDLHEQCRVVVQVHPEWNPAVLEQQIGRVDRKGSLWARRWQTWRAGETAEPPTIAVRQLVFRGTYDEFHWACVAGRRRQLEAALFGQLLAAESWDRVPADLREPLKEAAPRFEPARARGPVAAARRAGRRA